ncbi:MAG TPA: VWA domain-containing protein [Polyangiaceae bacterium]|nr:VWA domain-containing protein [Polyangiaceae bacterium]
MRFAAPYWLFGSALALAVAVLLIAGGFLLMRATRRFGDEALVLSLVTGRPGGRRALKGGLLVTAVALAFLALAQPQYGRGTRMVPATNLDVVVVLDFSKSMYARDIAPSRTLRAKSEVSRLIADLPGARFGAVAFAGQPMAFPLTSDGGAISQFFRQLAPNDMPVGGTAIARALEAGRDLFARDPLSKQHKKVMLLVTDGEDLEGDPVAVAQNAAGEEISIDVVQVGGRTPEPIPEVNESGQVKGYRQDAEGKPLTTSLSAAGEEQLTKIASVGGGQIVRSAGGKTGIEVIAARLRKLMTEELSERVETVYADVFFYPLGLAALLLLLEVFVNETAPRARPAVLPPPEPHKRRRRRAKVAGITTLPGLLLVAGLSSSCAQAEKTLFERAAPDVETAIEKLKANDGAAAAALLEQYLSTGKCEKGELGTPERIRQRENASFDLGLALFRVGEQYGQRFGEEVTTPDGEPTPEQKALAEQRSGEVECALRVVRVVAGNTDAAPDFRAEASYLAGNLEFLRGDYRAAVKSYDAALKIAPGIETAPAPRKSANSQSAPTANESVGLNAAYNRSIALRRIEEEEKKKQEKEKDKEKDQKNDDEKKDQDKKDQDQKDDEKKDQAQKDAKNDDKQAQQDKQEPPSQGQDENQAQPPDSNVSQDEAILDQLEQAPTVQQQDAKNRALKARSYGMEDK